MNQQEKNLLYLFEKPYEPVSTPRGHGNMCYDVGTEGDVELRSRLARTGTCLSIPTRDDAAPERLGAALTIPRGKPFSFFLRPHRRAAKDLCDVFMKTQGVEDLTQLAARVQGQVNEGLFIYALSFCIIRKQELRGVRLPSLVEIFPNNFVCVEQLTEAHVKTNRSLAGQTESIIIKHKEDFSNTNLKPEHRVSYWREDYGLNSHHWHWHLVFPIDTKDNRDRKGELFFYMHSQIVARYDMERLSVGLNRVKKLENWREPVEDGYFSKLTVNNSGKAWGTRQDNTLMKDLRLTDEGVSFLDVTDLEIWRSRLLGAIHQGFMINREREHVLLSDDVTTGKRGIDILGDAFEADDDLSPNYLYYGDLHNMGHVILAMSHDPDNSHKEEMGVMGYSGTAMRDPVFYRWHKFVDDTFQEYKMTQTPYTFSEMNLPDIIVERVGVAQGQDVDNLQTGWGEREFEASRGLDFGSTNKDVKLQLRHLDHQPFDYHIRVNNKTGAQKQVTVRIFLAPRDNERGQPMLFMDQRVLWTEMDKFTRILKPGKNNFSQSSLKSSVTTSREFTFRELEEGRQGEPVDLCGCGWPQHLLLPRGKPEGMAFQLFVMVTDYEKDKVTQDSNEPRCTNAVSFCGIQDQKFPDARPMGFPFDRKPLATLLEQQVTRASDYAAS